MPRSSKNLSSRFAGHLCYLDQTRKKMDNLLVARGIVHRDIHQVYAGLYIEAITSFERLIENLFVGLLSGSVTSTANQVTPLVSFRNRQAMRSIVYGGRKFGDWLPYDRTEQLANRFFRNGLPFTSLNSADKRHIGTVMYIRNAIAHKSDYSKRMFERNVLRGQMLTSREKTPTGYLRSVFRTAPAQNRYQQLTIEMASIATKLCS